MTVYFCRRLRWTRCISRTILKGLVCLMLVERQADSSSVVSLVVIRSVVIIVWAKTLGSADD
jgi:hypothetical protein